MSPLSFAYEAKAELCREKTENKAAATAECYGICLFCHTFSAEKIKITTANREFAARIPRLFKKAFGIAFDVFPEASGEGSTRSVFEIRDPQKLKCILEEYGQSPDLLLAHHVNFGVLEGERFAADFIRGAFLAGGTVTDPSKRYHLEFATSHRSVARETVSILQEMGFRPGLSNRGADALIYFKQADMIADLLTALGASTAGMNVITAKVDKEMKNTITRQINCDSANADKTVTAAQKQLAAIRKFAAVYGLDGLPEPLRDAALLRITNPETSLSDLSKLSFPPVSKSCLSHRLKRIEEMAEKAERTNQTEDSKP